MDESRIKTYGSGEVALARATTGELDLDVGFGEEEALAADDDQRR
jgi:hypothetical protein